MKSRPLLRARAPRVLLAAFAATALTPALASAQSPQCPTTVNSAAFPSQATVQQLVRKEMSYGLRFPGSKANADEVKWIEQEMRKLPNASVVKPGYKTPFWLPTEKNAKGGLDLVKSGGLSVSIKGKTKTLPVASATPFSKPTPKAGGKAGRLVVIPASTKITKANAKGKVIVRDFQEGGIPYDSLRALGLYQSPDNGKPTGDFVRPYLTPTLDSDLIDAGKAGAVGMVIAFDIPRKQAEGYFDPHDGTFYRVPAVFVGHEQATELKRLAKAKRSARVTVRAQVIRNATDHNLLATIPGSSPQKIVLAVNHDGAGWVQDNGVAGLIAFGRYYAALPIACRSRTLVIAFGANHTSVLHDGIDEYAKQLDKEYDEGKVAFAMSVEHLGTREVKAVKSGTGRKLVLSSKPEPWLWAVGPSDALRSTIIGAVQRRALPMVNVLRGASAPTDTVPNICSFGGLGGAFHQRLIPSAGIISGPRTLYGPGQFGEKALDYALMRQQLLTVGDTVLAIDDLTQEQIAGTTYPDWRKQRAAGKATCAPDPSPQDAPAS